jgi:hypothetical protein
MTFGGAQPGGFGGGLAQHSPSSGSSGSGTRSFKEIVF